MDQTSYLIGSYRLQEEILNYGFGALWKEISEPVATGIALSIDGALSGLLLGGTRLPQLFVNFLAFIAFQLVIFQTARIVWKHYSYGYLAVGLVLCQNTLWYFVGGLFDFRIDFFAYCFYGIWACCIIRSDLFHSRRGSMIVALVAAILVLHRYFIIVYMFGVLFGLFAILLTSRLFFDRTHLARKRLLRRSINLCASFAVTGLIVAPSIWISRHSIYGYYVVGHIIGKEKDIRAAVSGTTELLSSLLFYPKSVIFDHWGVSFLLCAALALLGGLLGRLFCKPSQPLSAGPTPPSPRDETFFLQILFLLGAIVGPLIVLTTDVAKSNVVGGVVGGPAALLLVALSHRLAPWRQAPQSNRLARISIATSAVALVLGIGHMFLRASHHEREYADRQTIEQIVTLERWMTKYADERGWTVPKVSFDVISDWLNAGTLAVEGYEKERVLLRFSPMLGGSIFSTDKKEALRLLADSDFFLSTTLPQPPYPFDNDVVTYQPELKRWADENMVAEPVGVSGEYTVTTYARPTALLAGISAGWITSSGMTIDAKRTTLERFPMIRLAGTSGYVPQLPRVPTISATINTASGDVLVPASLRRVNAAGYEILVDTSAVALPQSDQIIIHLVFDAFFVPKALGMNADTRELVVLAPTSVRLGKRDP